MFNLLCDQEIIMNNLKCIMCTVAKINTGGLNENVAYFIRFSVNRRY